MPEKVKIVSAYDNDTFKVQLKDGTTKSVRLISGNNQAWYDGFEKNQPGFKLDEAVSSLIGKEVNINFKKQSEDDYKKNFTRELGSISTATIPDLAEHLYNKTQIYKRDSGKSWTLNKPEVQTDSLMNPQQFKAVQNLLIKKDPSLQPKQVLAYKREIESAKNKFSFKTDKELIDFINRRSTVPYESLKTFQLQVPTKQSTMATPVKNKSLKVSGKPVYKDSGKSYKTISIDEANALIDNNQIVGTKVDQLRKELEQSGFVKDLAGYELHDANGTKYLFPIFKGNSQKNFKQALKSNKGEELSAFGNRYATSEQAIKTWKDQFGISPTYTNSIQDNVTEVTKNNGTVPLDYTKTATQPFNPFKNVEKNSGFLTKNLVLPKKDKSIETGNSDPAIKDWGSALASIVFNIGSLGVVEPVTSGVLNSTANAFTRKATGRSYTDDLGWNLADDLLGFSGAAGYVTGAGFAGEAASTANSARKIFKQVSTIKNVLKTNKALKTTLLAGITAEYGQEVGKEIYNLIEKPNVTMDDILKSSGRLAMLAPDLLMAKKRFKKGFTEGAKPLPVPEFKKGGVLKFQNGQALPYNYQTDPLYNPQLAISNFTGITNQSSQNPYASIGTNFMGGVRTTPVTTKRFNLPLKYSALGNNNKINFTPNTYTANTPAIKLSGYNAPTRGYVKPAFPIANIKATGNSFGNNYDYPKGSEDFSTVSDKPAMVEKSNNRTGFGYQEANLALSVLPMLLNQKVKADKLTYQPYNPAIRGIQGDPLLQQRLTSIAQNKYLQNKATSSDPSQELVRRLIVNRQAMQGNQEAYNVDTQARISDTQRYYGEKNAADQYNLTNKMNVDNQNIQINNNAMMQNAAQKNQVMGQTIQNIMGYMTNKANDQTLLGQNYLVHKNQENQGVLDNITAKYASMYNQNLTDVQKSQLNAQYNKELFEAKKANSVNSLYAPNQQTLQRAGVWKFKKGGSISDETKVLSIVTTKGVNLDKVFIDSARKYNELSSKVSTEALNRGSRLVVNALNNLPKTMIKSLPFKKLL